MSPFPERWFVPLGVRPGLTVAHCRNGLFQFLTDPEWMDRRTNTRVAADVSAGTSAEFSDDAFDEREIAADGEHRVEVGAVRLVHFQSQNVSVRNGVRVRVQRLLRQHFASVA